MSKRYVWMKDTDDEIADQLVFIAINMGKAPFKALLNINDDDEMMGLRLALAFRYLQKDLIGTARTYSTSLSKARDLLEVDNTPETFELPPAVWPPLPDMPDGSPVFDGTIITDIFKWFDIRVKQWKVVPAFTDAMQLQMGLVVPSGGGTSTAGPQVRGVKALPGGILQVDAFRGGHPLVLIEGKVEGGPWTLLATAASSRVTVRVPAGTSHNVDLRSRFAERDGTPVGDYSQIFTISSIP